MTTPTPHQQKAANAILDRLTSGGQCVLAGYAGTGKSFTTGYIAKTLVDARYSVMAVTHAHKALAVLSDNLPSDVTTSTMFSALGWRINGRTQSVVETGRHKLTGVDILLVDEASMIDQRMYQSVQRYTEMLGISVLWIGDPAQLPPVGEDGRIPPVFALVEEQYRLQEIVRQGEDSPIIAASMYVRRCLESSTRPDIYEMQAKAPGGAIQITTGGIADVAQTMISAIDHGLDARAIGWTNKSVERVNSIVSRHYHPPGTERLVNGDPVTFGSTLVVNDKPMVSTDAMGVVESASRVESHGCMEIPCLSVAVTVGGTQHTVSTPCDISDYSAKLRKIKRQFSQVKSAEKSASHDKIGELLERRDQLAMIIGQCQADYADLRHVYASTAHKAQGSTFDVAVIDWQDMQRNSNNEMLSRLLYVAVTRPSQFLIIIDG